MTKKLRNEKNVSLKLEEHVGIASCEDAYTLSLRSDGSFIHA